MTLIAAVFVRPPADVIVVSVRFESVVFACSPVAETAPLVLDVAAPTAGAETPLGDPFAPPATAQADPVLASAAPRF